MLNNNDSTNGQNYNELNGKTYKNDEKSLKLSTRAIHCGQSPSQWTHRSLIPPIVNSTTFELDVEQLFDENFKGNEYEYSRSGNPTRKCLEEAFASLENANYGLVFSSGMSAEVTICHLLKSGDQIICFDDIYGGTHRYFQNCITNYEIDVKFVDMSDLEKVKNAITHKTRILWIESPSNPLMKIVDLKGLNEIRNQLIPNSLIVCDNTFMSPVFQNPLNFGIDIVLHSLSKYINGHADVIMGGIAINRKHLFHKLKTLQRVLGTIPSPIDCYLANRGLKTLTIRMNAHQRNGFAVAQFLESHSMVRKVLYSGLKSHPQHELAVKQSSGCSGMISFFIRGNSEQTKVFLKSVKLFKLVMSLGSVESRVEVPSLMSHASVPKQHLEAIGVDDSLIRLSVGIEDYNDLINDLNYALNKAQQSINTII